jgi:hypothetical protein
MDGEDWIFLLDSEYGAMTPPVRGGYRPGAAIAAVDKTSILFPALQNLLRPGNSPLSCRND